MKPLSQNDQLTLLGELIADSPHNLVSARDRELISVVHIPECVEVLKGVAIKKEQHWIDLGTGGGLPGLVAAILYPDTGWTLIDATKKKIDAVDEFISVLGLENARAVVGRAEELAREEQHRGLYDGVVSRAMARLDVVAELARGFLHAKGQLVCIKGPKLKEERGYFQRVSKRIGLREKSTVLLEMPHRETHVVTLSAVGPPPKTMPRENGVPQRTPLGGKR